MKWFVAAGLCLALGLDFGTGRAEVLEGVAGAVPISNLKFARRLTHAERAYYGRIVATLAKATRFKCPALAVEGGEVNDSPSPDEPAALVPEEGELIAGAAFPTWRMGIDLDCEPDKSSDQVNIFPSAEPHDARKGAKRILEQRDGFVLFVHEYGVAALAVDAPVLPSGTLRASAVRPIRSVEFQFHLKDLDAGIAAARAVDVAAVQNALASGYPPPPDPAECGVRPGGAIRQRGHLDRDEVAVYEAVIREQLKRGAKGQVIADVSDAPRVDESTRAETLKASPCVHAETLADFSARAGRREPLHRKWLEKAGFVVTSEAQRAKAFQSNARDPWTGFKSAFPESNGVVHFSRVGFNADLSQAMVYIGWTGGMLLGSGEVYVLEKIEGRWLVLYVSHQWIS